MQAYKHRKAACIGEERRPLRLLPPNHPLSFISSRTALPCDPIFRKKYIAGIIKISDVNENSSEAEISNLNKDIKLKEGLMVELIPVK